MQVKCSSCQKAFLIDEVKYAKLPESVKCPKCGNPIKLAEPAPQKPQETKTESQPAKFSVPRTQGSGEPEAERGAVRDDADRIKEEVLRELFSLLPVGARRSTGHEGGTDDEKPKALVCEDEQMFQEMMRSTVERLGYEVEITNSTQASVDALRDNDYQLVTVDHRFPDDEEGGIKILRAINGLPSEIRRKMFVAFISANLETMDTSSAFVYGANLTVAKKDIKKLEQILKQGIEEHDKRYKTFFEMWEQVKRSEFHIPPAPGKLRHD